MSEDKMKTATAELNNIMDEMKLVAEVEITKIHEGRNKLREELKNLLYFTGYARQFLFDLMGQYETPEPSAKIVEPLVPKQGPDVMDYAQMQQAFDKMRQREHEITEQIKDLDHGNN